METTSSKTSRILIADDEVRIQFCVSLALRMRGHNVYEARDGRSALQMIVEEEARGHPFDLLICDVQMPHLNGEELLERLKVLGISLPILVITGYGEKELVVRLMRNGCRDFIDKPFDPDDIVERTEKLLSDTARNAAHTRRDLPAATAGEQTRALAHDLNNLLSGAVGYADLALERCQHAECLSNYLKKILASTTLAARVCRSILSRELIEGNEEPLLAVTEAATVVERAAAAVKGIAPPGVTVSVEVKECQVWIRADAQLLQRAILNLAVNAMDAMPEGGTLVVSLSKGGACRTGGTVPIECVIVSVADTGHGFAAAKMDKIFNKGYTTKSNGNGLGLPMVKTIMERHGGWVEIDSPREGGTVVTLFFPLNARNAREALHYDLP
ncbi:MAG: response regulator [Chitinivibrionales bacterium]|nr:response regulator [Chitinivibrionales bacterium]